MAATTTAIILAELNSDYERRQATKKSALDTSMEESLLTSNAGDTLDTWQTHDTIDTFETAKITNVTSSKDHLHKSVVVTDEDEYIESLEGSGSSRNGSDGLPMPTYTSMRQGGPDTQGRKSRPLEKLQELFQRTFNCACNVNTIHDDQVNQHMDKP